jgi:hypothetical protein
MPWPPLIAIAAQIILIPFLIYVLGLEAIGIGAGNEGLIALAATVIWMALGLVIYYGYSMKKEVEKNRLQWDVESGFGWGVTGAAGDERSCRLRREKRHVPASKHTTARRINLTFPAPAAGRATQGTPRARSKRGWGRCRR